MRCFPRCSAIHKTKSFCGQSLYVTVKGKAFKKEDVILVGEFRNTRQQPSFAIGHTVPSLEFDEAYTEGVLLRQIGDQMSFAINPIRKWKFDGKLRPMDHYVFTVFLVVQSKVVAITDTPSFSIIPIWKLPGEEGGEEEEETAAAATTSKPKSRPAQESSKKKTQRLTVEEEASTTALPVPPSQQLLEAMYARQQQHIPPPPPPHQIRPPSLYAPPSTLPFLYTQQQQQQQQSALMQQHMAGPAAMMASNPFFPAQQTAPSPPWISSPQQMAVAELQMQMAKRAAMSATPAMALQGPGAFNVTPAQWELLRNANPALLAMMLGDRKPM